MTSKQADKIQIEPQAICLTRTCEMCPEQYDATYKGQPAGYLRMRSGLFYVEYPYAGGIELYATSNTIGDGCFDDSERERFLNHARELIAKQLMKDGKA